MSSAMDTSGWSSSRLIPSIVFVLTPCVAVGLLVTWSLRMQFARQRWHADMASRSLGASNTIAEPRDPPKLHEVWLGSSWEDKIRDRDSRDGKKAKSEPPLQSYVRGQYSWQTILPIAFGGASRPEGWCELGVLVRMPCKTPYHEVSHTAIPDTEVNIGTVTAKPPSTAPTFI